MMWLRQSKRHLFVLTLGLVLVAPRLEAQAGRAALDSLRQVAARIGARLDSLEAGLCPSGAGAGELSRRPVTGNPAVDSLGAALDRLEIGLHAYALALCAGAAVKPAAKADSAVDELAALPWQLRLELGQFRQTVGELNRWHLHAPPEDEYLRVIRRSSFWQLSRSTYSQMSVSGQYGTNPDTSLTTSLGVAAARFAWRPPQHALTRGFTLRGEFWALKRKFELAPPNRFDRTGLGGYVDGTGKLNRQWGADVHATSRPEQVPAEEIRTS